jgi:hypothetical protein
MIGGGGLEPNKTTAKEQETSSSAIIPSTIKGSLDETTEEKRVEEK